MSSQGLNSSSYQGFYFAGTTGTIAGYTGITFGAGIPTGFPTRDSSDYTKRIKEIAFYREYNTASVSVDYTVVQSNQNRLTYNFGHVGCTGCTGPFPMDPVPTDVNR